MKQTPTHLTPAHQQAAARARTQLPDFQAHNRRIAPDGAARQRVMLRAPKGSRLLKPSDVHLLWLHDLRGDLGAPLSEQQQRMLLSRYVWQYVWEQLPCPPAPTQETYLAKVETVTARVRRGLPLLSVLDVIYVAPEDFADHTGRPLRRDQQRAAFRAALSAAREHAVHFARQAHVHEPRRLPLQRGRRRPMAPGTRVPPPRATHAVDPLYAPGRADLPPYEQRSPRRPYGTSMVRHTTHAYWLTNGGEGEDE